MTISRTSNEPPSPPGDDDLVEADDAVIALVFRRSLLVILALAIAVAGALLWRGRTPAPAVVDEVPLQAPLQVAAIRTKAPPEVTFTDVTASAGIEFRHHNGAYGDRLLPETMGGGVAVLDFDSDGNMDLLFVNSGNWSWRDDDPDPGSPLALYRNLGDGRFEDVSYRIDVATPFYGMGAAAADYDSDGDTDLFVTAVGRNRLLRNEDGKRFVEVEAGVAGRAEDWSTSAAFFDYDADGDLDLFVANYVRWSREIDFEVDYRLAGLGRAYGPPTNYAGSQSCLYRNDGGVFTDVSASAGVQVFNAATGQPAGKALAVMPLDVDLDGRIDLIVANDTVQNFLFLNTGGGFEEQGASVGVAYNDSGSATGAMGVDAARYNNNLDLAIAVGNFANEMTSFYVAQDGSGLFSDETIVSGVGPESRRALSFGLFFFDYDLDGRLDLFQANGHVENEINVVQPSQNYAQPAQLFWNCGADCPRQFIAVAQRGDLSTPMVGRGAAYLDMDGDGDLDVVVTQVGAAPRLFRNDQSLDHHWIRIRLEGTDGNTDAIGARVALTAAGQAQFRTVTPARSYLSSVELVLTFGLADVTVVDTVSVTWPDGRQQVVNNLEIDRAHVIRQAVGRE